MTVFTDSPRLPTIDLSLFDLGDPWRDHVGAQIDWAAAEFGIFRILGHGIDRGLLDSMVTFSRRYFARADTAERPADLCFTADSTATSGRGCICLRDGTMHCGQVNRWFVQVPGTTLYN